MGQEYYMDNDEIEIDLLKIIKAVWKKLWLVILVGVVLGGGMFAFKKLTFVPSYDTYATMYGSAKVAGDNRYTEDYLLMENAKAILHTRKTMEKIIEAADLDLTYEEISKMVYSHEVSNSTLFRIGAKGTDPEELALIANTAADILPEMVTSVYGDCEIMILDYAEVPEEPVNSDSAVGAAGKGAVLGAMLVCACIAGKEIYLDWTAAKRKKKES